MSSSARKSACSALTNLGFSIAGMQSRAGQPWISSDSGTSAGVFSSKPKVSLSTLTGQVRAARVLASSSSVLRSDWAWPRPDNSSRIRRENTREMLLISLIILLEIWIKSDTDRLEAAIQSAQRDAKKQVCGQHQPRRAVADVEREQTRARRGHDNQHQRQPHHTGR